MRPFHGLPRHQAVLDPAHQQVEQTGHDPDHDHTMTTLSVRRKLDALSTICPSPALAAPRAGVGTQQLATRALAQGVVVESKAMAFAGARPPARTIRPGCSSIDARQIAPRYCAAGGLAEAIRPGPGGGAWRPDRRVRNSRRICPLLCAVRWPSCMARCPFAITCAMSPGYGRGWRTVNWFSAVLSGHHAEPADWCCSNIVPGM